MYGLDRDAYPPQAPDFASRALVKRLSTANPRGIPYFEFTPDMLDPNGDIRSPLDWNTGTIKYRHGSDATARNKASFDIWCTGPDAINNWEP